jgi:hypothetical protein
VRGKRDRSGVLGFANKRSWAYWHLREELDPEQDGGSAVALPPDPELMSELSAPTFETKTIAGLLCIKVETKDDVKKKLGKSPDKADAVAMSLAEGDRIVLKQKKRGRKDLPTGPMLGIRRQGMVNVRAGLDTGYWRRHSIWPLTRIGPTRPRQACGARVSIHAAAPGQRGESRKPSQARASPRCYVSGDSRAR